jgi:hypothetical protein
MFDLGQKPSKLENYFQAEMQRFVFNEIKLCSTGALNALFYIPLKKLSLANSNEINRIIL